MGTDVYSLQGVTGSPLVIYPSTNHALQNATNADSAQSFKNGIFPAFSFNNTSHHSNDTESSTHTHWSILEKAIFGTWLSISMVLAILGNLMVIAVVWRHRGMRTRTNMFLVNLAVADFLVGILMAPFSLTTLLAHDWILGDVLCFANSFLTAVCFITSIQTLMFISIHKYLSITRPLARITKCKIMIMIVASWSWGVLCAALTTFILSKATYKKGTMQCGPKYPEISTKSLLFHFIIQTSDIFLPLLIMLFCYLRMFREIKEHMHRLDENTQMDRQQIYSQQRRVTVTLFIVLTCFVLCWIPYCVYANYVTFTVKKEEIPRYANAIAYCFGYMNSACNPIIYAWRSPSFREGYKEILCQEPSYVVSDDTIHDSSPSPRRRLSAFISSLRGSRASSRHGSEESITGHHVTTRGSRGGSQSSYTSTHKMLRKLTSRTSTIGTSIIRQEGSVITIKNGKIVSMRQENSLRRKKADILDDVFLPSPSKYPKSNSLPASLGSRSVHSNLQVVHENGTDSYEMEPLIRNGSANGSVHAHDVQVQNRYDKKEASPRKFEKETQNLQLSDHISKTDTRLTSPQKDIRAKPSKPRKLVRQNGQCDSSFLSHLPAPYINTSESALVSTDNTQNFDIKQCKSEHNVFKLPLLNAAPISNHKLKVNHTMHKSSSDTDLSPNESKSHDTHVTYRRRWTYSKDEHYEHENKETIFNTKL